MKKAREANIENKLDAVISLLQYLVALELSQRGVPQSTIGKHLHVAKSTVVDMRRGVEKRSKADDRAAA
jgi:DNA-binding MarR family transcriptional regulator